MYTENWKIFHDKARRGDQRHISENERKQGKSKCKKR
jgi:hypothetical protein